MTPRPPVRAPTAPETPLRTRFEFIYFVEMHEPGVQRLTKVWDCRNNRSGESLGEVSWYSSWRQYCFSPSGLAVFSAGCLRDIAQFIASVKDVRNG